ncbi:MAG: molybdenum cofactor biosynthesis protein MoaE [Desulfobacteraceae bacterium]|nr:molybdenum cofactor biosynthesis protein MoaE [Desulfobacteraceae bacterium]
MDVNKMIKTLKGHPDYPKMGMIASHLGVVRETSLSGEKVMGIEVEFDQNVLKNIISEIKKIEGIVDVLIDTDEGYLNVGEDIMAVVVGGDTREHVFPALVDTVNRIKTEATQKKEQF